MSDVKTDDPPSVANTASLVQGIVGDIGELIKHEVRYARAEFQSDLGKMKTAAATLLAGAAAGLVGFVLLSLMLVYGLHTSTLPADAELAKGLPLWAAYGIVGVLFLVIGGTLGYLGADRLGRVNPLPDKALEKVQKDVSWIANQTANSK
ncbi:MAG: phage holin family protein [Gemmataceae bacterium]